MVILSFIGDPVLVFEQGLDVTVIDLVSVLAIQLKGKVVTGDDGTHEINTVIKAFVVFVIVIVRIKQCI
jgi:hypothetical protein